MMRCSICSQLALLVVIVGLLAGCDSNSADRPTDSDRDGVVDALDFFPTNPDESADSDRDGVGNNSDTFPNDAAESADTDNDGVGDNGDAFPADATESADSDGDGVGDNQDVFPLDASESADRDFDGVGDNGDALPDDPSESSDIDADGVGDNGDNCPTMPNPDQADRDVNGAGDLCEASLDHYAFASAFEPGASSVNYSGQTARHLLISGLTAALSYLTERPGEGDAIAAELWFYIAGTGADVTPHGFTVRGGELVVPGPNYGDVSTGKNLIGKIAGGDGAGGGETTRLINGEFFGWSDGMDADPVPAELVRWFVDRLSAEASDGETPLIAVPEDPSLPAATVTVDAHGRDLAQLLTKFVGGAVSFSQGTHDYLQTDFAANLARDGDSSFSVAEHHFDEAFGYLGPARDLLDYTDVDAAAAGGRVTHQRGYFDTNDDGDIDLRSEFVFGHAQNCAKRDAGAGEGAEGNTDFTTDLMRGFITGRQIIASASLAGELSDIQRMALDREIRVIATTWEKCVAATVIHYINDTTTDIDQFESPNFQDAANFLNLAKHWSEMKGFALALQFSPFSPFRDDSVADINVDDLKHVLALMGDAPVLADGSRMGLPPVAGHQAAVDAYRADLRMARDILQTAYDFAPETVATW